MASSSTLPRAGMPILSGHPPISESSSCHQCNKSFNVFTRRSHACGHCGYEYCAPCLADGQALMPRNASRQQGNGSVSGSNNPFSFISDIADTLGLDDRRGSGGGGVGGGGGGGYEVEKVCTRCLGMLQVTSAPVERLRTLPLKRLKEYLGAYDIELLGPTEKEDFVQGVVKARDPRTGCLSPEKESHYRRHSVPKGASPQSSSSNTHARPPPPNRPRPPPPHQSPRPPPLRPQQARPPPPHTHTQSQYRPPPSRPHPQSQYRPPPAVPQRPTPPSPAPAPPRQPSPPVPTILSLVSLPRSYLGSLSIGTLKAILFDNHVRVDFKQVLEKEELVTRVFELVSAERRRLERQRYEEEREAREAAAATATATASANETGAHGTSIPGGDDAESGQDVLGASPGTATTDKPAPTGPMPEIERGLCVVCQDEEATLAVVDCGHLCMCAHCSDLIMATSKECPLCRTRIVTGHRLIRIYRV